MQSLTAIASGGGSNTSLADNHSSVSTEPPGKNASSYSSGESTNSSGLAIAGSGGSTSSSELTTFSSGGSTNPSELASLSSGVSVGSGGSKDTLSDIKSSVESGDGLRPETLVGGGKPTEPLQTLKNVKFITGGWSWSFF